MTYQDPKYKFVFLCIIFILGLSFQLNNYGHAEDTPYNDEIFQISIVLDGYDISEAVDKSTAILIDPEKGVMVNLNCSLISDDTVSLDDLKITFRIADFDIFSKEQDINLVLKPGDDVSIFQVWTFGVNMSVGDFDLLGGIYQIRYDLHYTINSTDKILEGEPFYIQISENPLATVSGLISTATVAVGGLSVISMVSSMIKSVPMEVSRAIESTLISPSNQLKGTYQANLTKGIQDQVSHAAFSYVKSEGFEKCPKCETDWSKNNNKCPNCNISLSEAEELAIQNLSNKSMNTCKELVDSASALSVGEIALKLGQGITPTSSIIYVLTYAGFAFTKPRLGKSWNEKTRKLIIRLLETGLFMIFWIQAAGVDTISLNMMIIGLLTAAIPGIVISKIVEGMILAKAKLTYKKED